jgi:hypothetical protein
LLLPPMNHKCRVRAASGAWLSRCRGRGHARHGRCDKRFGYNLRTKFIARYRGGSMNKKSTAIIVTIAAALLCVCPGLFSMFMGGLFAAISYIPGADIDIMGSADPQTALMYGIGMLCGGLLFLLIGAGVIFFTLRRKPGIPPEVNEPL